MTIYLTDKEREAAAHVAAGLTNKQIALAMDGITMQRVRVLISAVAYKIGADATKNERVQVALWWHANEAATVAKHHSA